MGNFKRCHPILVFFNLKQFLFLIVIPVIRGFITALSGDILDWIAGSWLDILVLSVIVTLAVLNWYFYTYDIDSEKIVVKKGVLYKKETVVFFSKVTTVSITDPFYLRIFGAQYLRADTLGGGPKRTDLSIYLSQKNAEDIKEYLQGEFGLDSKQLYVPKTSSILALALLTSNSLGGILFFSTFISQTGKLLGEEISEMVLTTFEDIARKLAFGLPPATAAIAYTLIFSWILSFIVAFLTYRNFNLRRSRDILYIKGGTITPRRYYIKYRDINFADIRQSIITKTFKLYSMYISAVGYGKRNDDIRCVIPTENKSDFYSIINVFFPDFKPNEVQIKPARTGIMRFVSAPLLYILLIISAIIFTIKNIPSWRDFAFFTGFMLFIPALIYLAVRIMDFMTSGIGCENGYITMRYSKGLQLHTVVIPKERIVGVKLRSSLIQRISKRHKCNVYISAMAEKRTVHKCQNLFIDEAERLLNQL